MAEDQATVNQARYKFTGDCNPTLKKHDTASYHPAYELHRKEIHCFEAELAEGVLHRRRRATSLMVTKTSG